MKIGAVHEICHQVRHKRSGSGIAGRMSGYWKQEILGGHKTGPYRTSIEAILEYEEFYKNPLKIGKYTTAHRNKPFVSEIYKEFRNN
jgi:hypothetical protein